MEPNRKLDDITFLKIAVIALVIGFVVLLPGMVASALQEGQTVGANITVIDKMTALEADPDYASTAVTVYYVIGEDGAEFRLHGPGPYALIQPGGQYHIEYSTKTIDDRDIWYIEAFHAI